MPNQRHNVKTVLVLFTGAMVLATCLAGAWTWQNLREIATLRTSTRYLLLEWERYYSTLKDAETGARGFLLTQLEPYLAPFENATVLLPELMQNATRLEQEVKSGYSPAELAQIQRATDNFLSKKREIISVLRREGREPAYAMVKEGLAKAHMDTARQLLEKRINELRGELDVLDAQMQSQFIVGGRSIAALGIAAIIAGLAAWTVLRDLMQQARRAERLTTEKLKADLANREKSTFLATMSHEIRTPMNAILGFGELLLNDARDEKQKNYAGSIVRSGNALLQLINDILDLSKIEAGMLEIASAPVNVRELADFTKQLFSYQCSSKGVDLIVEVSDDIPQSLLLDGARLRQIVLNLVGNAIKFTNAGHVSLKFGGKRSSGERSTYQLELRVDDTGTGIPADRLPEIFDPFVQAKASRDTELKGTGLGLAIVKRLTTLMGGTIHAESEEGKGASFILMLPRVEISARLAKPSISDHEDVDFNQIQPSTILVVDDNPVNLALVQGYFDDTHHTIHTAANGQEALEWLSGQRPDVVLMDIRMPVMDGRTALREIRVRKNLELLPVIAVTASSMAREEEDLRQVFDAYLRKPFSRVKLYEELSNFIAPATKTAKPLPEISDEPAPPEWHDLVHTLREIERKEWPVVSAGMVMSEVQRFASSLQEMGKAAKCPPLESLAAKIQSYAASFALDDLEKSLATFPTLIDQLEQRLSNRST